MVLKMISRATKVKLFLAERSFDLRTYGVWAQHASTAPLCDLHQRTANRLPPAEKTEKHDEKVNKLLSEAGFEPTPTEVDCDLNAAP